LIDIAKAAGEIGVIRAIPPGLAILQLHGAQCAALDLCSAMLDYLTTVIQYINMGVLGTCLLSFNRTEMAGTTLFRGEKPLEDRRKAIDCAITAYRGSIADLALPVMIDIHADLRAEKESIRPIPPC
jgi:hypothetical protein